MGSLLSKPQPLVDTSSGEIPAYVQRNQPFLSTVCLGSTASPSWGLFTEATRFNDPKPHALNPHLTDDTWAALKLRVDPLARNLLDPHRSYAVAALLALLIGAVFWAVSPRLTYDELKRRLVDDDDAIDDGWIDDYIADDLAQKHNGIDDVVWAEWQYRNEELDARWSYWRWGFFTALSVLWISTVTLAFFMERRNRQGVDVWIGRAVEEIRPRVLGEGFDIVYRTRENMWSVVLLVGRNVRPERVIVFRRLDGMGEGGADAAARDHRGHHGAGGGTSEAALSPPGALSPGAPTVFTWTGTGLTSASSFPTMADDRYAVRNTTTTGANAAAKKSMSPTSAALYRHARESLAGRESSGGSGGLVYSLHSR